MLRLLFIFICNLTLISCMQEDSSQPEPLSISFSITPSVYEGEEVTIQITSNKPLNNLQIYWEGLYLNSESIDMQTGLATFTAQNVYEDTDYSVTLYAHYQEEEFKATGSYTVKNQILVTKEPRLYNTAVQSIEEHLLRLGYIAEYYLDSKQPITSFEQTTCENGGVYSLTYTDSDNNSELSQGDTIVLDYLDCFVQVYNDILQGEITFTIIEKADFTTQVEIAYQQVLVGYERKEYSGILSAAIYSKDKDHKLSVKLVDSLSVAYDDIELDASNYQVSKDWSLNSATFEITTSGSVVLNQQWNFTVETASPWFGYLGEVPHQGQVKITGAFAEEISLNANFVINSQYISVLGAEREFDLSWRGDTASSFYSFAPLYSLWPKEFSANNFDMVAVLNDINKIGTLEPINVIFSRPIAELTEYELSAYGWLNFGTTYVNFNKTFDGAVLTLKPESPLVAGVEYNFNSGLNAVLNEKNVEGNLNSLGGITVDDTIVPVITADKGYFNSTITPKLDAYSTELNEGEVLNYLWLDVNELGLTFTNPTGVTTEVEVPDEVEDDLLIHLQVTNELGNTATSELKIFAQPPNGTFVYIKGVEGDYISQGYDRMLNPVVNEFSFSSNHDQTKVIELNTDNDPYWSFQFAAPEGTTLSTGEYTSATRYPFNDSAEPGISISGEHRGCNQHYGAFVIHQLSYAESGEIDKLAIDFTQRCESKESPELSGVIRYNSNIPIED